MQHGRDHEERELKVKQRRNGTDDEGFEGELLAAGRGGGTPHQGVVGAHAERLAPSADLEDDEPVADGSEVAPTRRAEERERERHREERKRGRMAAGIGENLRDRREPGVDRETLDEAARLADAKVLGKS